MAVKLIAQTPIAHDGKDYAEGDALSVDSKQQAEQLLAAGAVRLAGGRKPAAEGDDTTAGGDA